VPHCRRSRGSYCCNNNGNNSAALPANKVIHRRRNRSLNQVPRQTSAGQKKARAQRGQSHLQCTRSWYRIDDRYRYDNLNGARKRAPFNFSWRYSAMLMDG
jgi:hypothetical protein